jgi:hypothetical protein
LFGEFGREGVDPRLTSLTATNHIILLSLIITIVLLTKSYCYGQELF